MTQTCSIRLRNSSGAPKSVWIEPWGDEIQLSPENVFTISAEGPAGDCLEVDTRDGAIAVYGWPDSKIDVYNAGQLLRQYSIPAPSTPRRK